MGFYPQENATNHQTDKADVIKLKSERTNERANARMRITWVYFELFLLRCFPFQLFFFHSCLPCCATDIGGTAAVAVAAAVYHFAAITFCCQYFFYIQHTHIHRISIPTKMRRCLPCRMLVTHVSINAYPSSYLKTLPPHLHIPFNSNISHIFCQLFLRYLLLLRCFSVNSFYAWQNK